MSFSCCLSLLLGTWLQRKGKRDYRRFTEVELQKGQYQNREGHNIRELPLTVIAKCIGGIWKERKEKNIPLLIRVVLLLGVRGTTVMYISTSLFVLHRRSPCAEGASAASSPSLCRVQQLNFHMAPLEET